METIKFSKVENILLNMQGGLLPKDLTKKEVKILKKEYGKDWFKILGYDENKYQKPKFFTKQI